VGKGSRRRFQLPQMGPSPSAKKPAVTRLNSRHPHIAASWAAGLRTLSPRSFHSQWLSTLPPQTAADLFATDLSAASEVTAAVRSLSSIPGNRAGRGRIACHDGQVVSLQVYRRLTAAPEPHAVWPAAACRSHAESLSHMAAVTKARLLSNHLQRVSAAFKHQPCGLQPQTLHRFGGD
jgi:hypothetical protein